MKRLRIIVFSFISILVIGIVLTNSLININLENGIHTIELENNNTKSLEVSVEAMNDTLKITDKNSLISDLEKDYIKSIFSFIKTNISLKNGLYKLTL